MRAAFAIVSGLLLGFGLRCHGAEPQPNILQIAATPAQLGPGWTSNRVVVPDSNFVNALATTKTGLVPLALRLPAPAFHSGPIRIDPDPHTETPPQAPRPAFLVPFGTTNLAFHKPATSSDTDCAAATLAKITDGDREDIDESLVSLRTGKQWVQIDLNELCEIYAVVLWHRQSGFPVFRCVAVQTADDSSFTSNVHTLFNNDHDNLLGLGHGADRQYYETYDGKLIDAKGVKGRYVRCYSRGSNVDRLNYYTEVDVWGLRPK